MKKSALRTAGRWVPITKEEANCRGLPVVTLAPMKASKFGCVRDQSVWFEMRIAAHWIVAFRLVGQRGQPVIAEVRVFPDEPGTRSPGGWSGEYGARANVPRGGITGGTLRAIRTGAFTKDLRKTMARKIWMTLPNEKTMEKGTRREGTWGKEEWETLFPAVPLSTVKPPATRGRKGRSDQKLARMAAVYARAYLANRPPVQAVAQAFNLSQEKARDAIKRARVRGLLQEASKRGQGGGLLTPLGKQMLLKKKHTTGGARHGTTTRR